MLCALGATDMQLADFFGVSFVTINAWKTRYPGFLKSLKIGKKEADERVVRSLYQRACGFEHDAVKVSFDKEGNPLYAPYREYVVPDTTACIFWLKNRDRDKWRDKTDVDMNVSGELKLAERLAEARKRK